MSRRPAVVAWSLVGLCVLITVAGIVLGVASSKHPPDWNVFNAILLPAAILTFSVVGAVVASKRPDNPLGWLFSAFGIVFASGVLADSYGAFRPGPLPAFEWAKWVALMTFNSPTIFTFFVFFLLLFPTGRLPTPRWRPLARFSIVTTTLLWVFIASTQGEFNGQHCRGSVCKPAPTGKPFEVHALLPLWKVVALPLTLSVVICVPMAAVAFVLRVRRSRGVERQQLKWFALAAAFFGVLIALFPLVIAIKSLWWLWPVLFAVGASGIPVAAGVAILRYRLYDIDRIISRTLSYAIVTAFLGGLFALVVLMPTTAFSSGGTPGWLVALATLVVFALFRPVLARVRSVVDRRFNRSRYDAARTIDAFSARLRDEIDLATLRQELTGVVGETMQPRHVSLWIRGATR